ncbi:hypothetical protein Ciccas_014556, partial [Cichlidogyrus casuarinus]
VFEAAGINSTGADTLRGDLGKALAFESVASLPVVPGAVPTDFETSTVDQAYLHKICLLV